MIFPSSWLAPTVVFHQYHCNYHCNYRHLLKFDPASRCLHRTFLAS
jgi:hypothetical protein